MYLYPRSAFVLLPQDVEAGERYPRNMTSRTPLRARALREREMETGMSLTKDGRASSEMVKYLARRELVRS